MRELKQSTAANVIIFMADSTDHITGKTGLTLTVTLSKDGGAFASITPTVTERTSGWYNIALTTSHTDTVGDLVVRATAAGADASERALNVVANVEADTYARVGAPAGASISADIAGVQADTDNIQTRLPAALVSGRMDASVGSNLDKTGYSLTQSFPANFASLSITAGGLVDITQAAADKVWGTTARTLTSFGTLAADVWAYTTRLLTAGTNIALAKGTGVTGFNDIAAADVWAVATRALTDKTGFSLAADQSAVTVGTVNSVADKTGYALSAAGVDAVLDEVVEGTYTMRQLMRLFASTLFAKSAGGGTATLTARDLGDTKNRITLTVDANGNRTAVTLDGA